MIIARLMPLAALLSLLAACGSSPTEAPPNVLEPTTGTWRGTSTRFQADLRSCPRPGLVTLRVLDGQFQYRWDGKIWIDAAIDPDGTVHGAGPGIGLTGKRTGAKMEGDVTNGTCGLHFTVMKQDT